MLPAGVYVVPLAEGQPRTVRAAAVVVGVLTDDVDELVEVVLVEEVETEDTEDVEAEEVGDELDCAETEEVDEAGSGVPEVSAADEPVDLLLSFDARAPPTPPPTAAATTTSNTTASTMRNIFLLNPHILLCGSCPFTGS